MIAKTTTGNDFEGALTYGAGQRQGRGKEPGEAPLLVVANLIPGSPKEMAQDMRTVAAQSKKIQKPVWHTVLSWKAGEVVTQAQKVAAAQRYCELIGAPIDRHQVVVYEHRDKKHAHVHIYLNRVPIDGGPALRTDNNFYRQPVITRQISQELGMDPIPERRRSLKALDPTKEEARERVSRMLQHLFTQTDRGGEEWLASQLQKELIAVRFTHDKGGILRGVSFETNGIAVRGQEVGYTGAQLRDAFATSLEQEVFVPKVESVPSRETLAVRQVNRVHNVPKRNRRRGPA